MTYAPQVLVGRVLRDPVRVHVLQQVVAAEWLKERVNAGSIVRRDEGTVWKGIGRIGRRHWIILAAQVAVLGIGAVAVTV